MALTLTPLTGIPLISPGDDLAPLILQAFDRAQLALLDGDIIILAQKIVSKAEGCLVDLTKVTPSPRALDLAEQTAKDPRLVEVILGESRQVLRTRPGVIVVEHRLGFICASAGVDHSNVHGDKGRPEDWVLLLPENPDASAAALRQRLEAASGRHLGVLIIDSHGRAWRMGTVGVAIGISGLPGLVDMRGWADLFDFRLQITQVGVADELAAAASLVMGQAAEGTPVVHARGFPYPLREASLGELIRQRDQDLFR
ncbi:MAG: coenzyme F420-0:L-glutamate ligase [Chloroflexi bacterium RBG_16_57_11]|nr:MAG: coenzyme F420-0:L-glutamate ligase [Chloroflexi bacterium RBG_16_57_11]